MSVKIILGAVIAIVAIAGIVWFGNDEGSMSATESPTVSVSPDSTSSPQASVSPTGSPTGSPQGTATKTPTPIISVGIKTFNVTGVAFSFTPTEIRVKKGDTVRIVFKNNQGNHDWTIDEFNARTPVIGAGSTATVQFVANKTGSFEYYCSVGNHRQLGMKGTLIVE